MPSLPCTPNAGLEWQAGNLRRQSRDLVEVCPLEGLVGLYDKNYGGVLILQQADSRI